MTIERAAKAVWLSRATTMDKADARILARAALEAVAEPTPEMIEAALEEARDHCWLGMDGQFPMTHDEMKTVLRAAYAAMMNS